LCLPRREKKSRKEEGSRTQKFIRGSEHTQKKNSVDMNERTHETTRAGKGFKRFQHQPFVRIAPNNKNELVGKRKMGEFLLVQGTREKRGYRNDQGKRVDEGEKEKGSRPLCREKKRKGNYTFKRRIREPYKGKGVSTRNDERRRRGGANMTGWPGNKAVTGEGWVRQGKETA